MIRLTAIGHIGRDATMHDAGDKKVIRFSIAVTNTRKNKDYTTWLNCSYWSESERLMKALTKGLKVYIEGLPNANSYTTKDGEERNDLSVMVSNIEFMFAPNTGNDQTKTEKMETANLTEEDDLPF